MANASTSAYARHLHRVSSYVHFYGGAPPPAPTFRSEREILEQNHRFIRDDMTSTDLDEEKHLAKQYYDSLFREFALVDLSRWREHKLALRWRTRAEVLAGQGQFSCGCLNCSGRYRDERDDRTKELKIFELNFAYVEDGGKKNSLVKVCVCLRCSRKLRRAQKPDDGKTGGSHKKRRHHSDSDKRSTSSQPVLKGSC